MMTGHNGVYKRRTGLQISPPVGALHSKDEDSSTRRCCTCACALLGITLGVAAIIGSVAYLCYYFLVVAESTEVKLSYGTVSGDMVTGYDDRRVRRYLGIPYAKAPVGNRRFADPEEIDKFPKDPYKATDYKYSCPQFPDTTYGTFEGSHMWNAPNPLREDCLFINIWAPVAPAHKEDEDQKLPVMAWLYGGGYYSGSSALDLYDGKILSSYGDVIVVSFNYRVGALGFLTTGDGRLKGNFGMMDQVLALKWIKKNIKKFGGDPNKITIFGESAGASSIGFLLLSPLGYNLFHRAIFESGGPESRWAFMSQAKARVRSDLFLNAVGCQQNDVSTLMDCLRHLDVSSIMNNEWVVGGYMEFPWVPTVDGILLTDTPANLISQGRFRAVDSILGVNANEGTFYNLYSLPGLDKDDLNSHHNFSMFVEAEAILNFDLTSSQRAQVVSYYAQNEIIDTTDLVANRDALEKVAGDRLLTCPTKAFAENMLEKGGARQYFYHLGHRATTEVWPPWMGVIHGAEIQWIFGVPLKSNSKYTRSEKHLSKTIIKYLSNFANTGDPNGRGLPEWPQHTLAGEHILDIAAPNTFIILNELRNNFCEFWDNLLS